MGHQKALRVYNPQSHETVIIKNWLAILLLSLYRKANLCHNWRIFLIIWTSLLHNSDSILFSCLLQHLRIHCKTNHLFQNQHQSLSVSNIRIWYSQRKKFPFLIVLILHGWWVYWPHSLLRYDRKLWNIRSGHLWNPVAIVRTAFPFSSFLHIHLTVNYPLS